jgi:uncharacterized protein (TIGR03382 family)
MASRRVAWLVGLALAAACGGELDEEARPIVGGHAAKPGAFPATGALVLGKAYHCTATLIAADMAVTAAHCLVDVAGGDLGFTLDTDVSDGNLGHVVPVFRVLRHPGFGGRMPPEVSRADDIGVVVLTAPIEGVEPARLIDPGVPLIDREVSELMVCGYGLELWYRPSEVGVKRDTVVEIDALSEWEVSTLPGESQPCFGDSGGPIFIHTPEGVRLLAVVSRSAGGSNRCDEGAIATLVAPYQAWMAEAALFRSAGGCSAGGGAASAWFAIALAALLLRRRR